MVILHIKYVKKKLKIRENLFTFISDNISQYNLDNSYDLYMYYILLSI